MLESFVILSDLCKNGKLTIANHKFDEKFKNYSFFYISKSLSFDQNHIIFENIRNSNLMIIKQITDNKKSIYSNFIVAFKKTVIFIEEFSIPFLSNLFLSNTGLTIYTPSQTKNIFDKYINICNIQKEIDELFDNEIYNFCQNLKLKTKLDSISFQLWKIIKYCIAGFLIKQSYIYLNTNKFDFEENNCKDIGFDQFSENDFFILRNISCGSSFQAYLIYHIEKESIFVIKKPFLLNEEIYLLMEREIKNYHKMNYPFIPKLFGTTINNKYPIIEFINGKTLTNINQIHLHFKDKINIIFELMLIINYLHKKEFVYRDLKPNNVIIDENKIIFLIDFDRMIEYSEITDKIANTADFPSVFAAPEFNESQILYQNDIYSLGQMIYYIINENYPTYNVIKNRELLSNYKIIAEIYKKCTNDIADERPLIKDLIIEFYIIFKSFIDIKIIQNDPEFQIIRNVLNFESYSNICGSSRSENINYFLNSQGGLFEILMTFNCMLPSLKYLPEDIKRSLLFLDLQIHNESLKNENNCKKMKYLENLASQNIPEAQHVLGINYLAHDINKSIYYLTLSANNNYLDSQYYLGQIFISNKFFPQQINKGIYYLSLAAKGNKSEAQFSLGDIYYAGEFVKKDINKGIYYLSLAANNNNSDAQFALANIYLDDANIEKDINKGIYYLSLAAKNNNSNAQYVLGIYYMYGKYVDIDVNKAFYYLSLSAKKNNSFAQSTLGDLYYLNGRFLENDINESIYSLSIAANNNNSEAQFSLGDIYLNGKNIEKDVNRGIYYLTLSAIKNNPNAQFALGEIYISGEYTKRNINKALFYLTKASDQNLFDAQIYLGNIYYFGQYVEKDIDKAIHYFTLASKNNDSYVQLILGLIYYSTDCKKNINQAIHYLTLSSKQNNSNAQLTLGLIYFESEYIPHDIDKAIYYLSLAANNNISNAQLALGIIYLSNKYGKQDIQKGIYYLTLASNQNNIYSQLLLGMFYKNSNINKSIQYLLSAANQGQSEAQYFLGLFYESGKYVTRNINKAIYYYKLAIKKNQPFAQYRLGFIYITNEKFQKNIKKGIHLLELSSINQNIEAYFPLAFFYHEGKYVERDIKKSVSLYKEGSSFNDQYSKNNLGILYKNGFCNEFEKKLQFAVIYFEEAIKQKNDEISKYNLSHVYIYEESTNESIKKSIKYLIESSESGFEPSNDLLCLALIKIYGINIDEMKKEISKYTKNVDEFIILIQQMIVENELYLSSNFERFYKNQKYIDFLYNVNKEPIISQNLQENEENFKSKNTRFKITKEFYEGFGFDLLNNI